MRHLFLVSLLSLAVGLGSCKKDEPDSPPALEGRWTPETRIVYYYDGAGALTYEENRPRWPGTYMVITKDSLRYHAAPLNVMLVQESGTISRLDERLIYRSSSSRSLTVLIKQLTKHKLTLRFTGLTPPLPGTTYDEVEETYSR